MDSNDSTERYIAVASMTLSGILGVLTVGLIGIVSYFCFANGVIVFSWHPPLMLIGFLLFMTQAILAFSTDNILSRNVDRSKRFILHWILQVGAASCILVAFICIYSFKVGMKKDHFQSTHGYLGFLTLLFCLGTIGGGILAANSVRLRHVIKPVIIKIVHATFGIISYSMAIVTIFLGLNSPWMHENLTTPWISVLIAIVASVWLYTVVKPLLTVFSRVGGLARTSQ